MKKVLIFSLAYFPKAVGGAEIAIKEITDRIPDIEFHLITNRFDSDLPRVEKIGNVLVHRIGITTKNPSMADLRRFPLHLNKFFFQFAAAFKALSLYRKYTYDATWAMMAHSTGVPAALFKLAHKRVPYVLTLQEGDPPESIERTMLPLWPLFSRAFTSADTVTAISTFLGEWARRRGFTGRLEIIPNAVNAKHFSKEYSQAALEDMKRKIGKGNGDTFLITTSRLVKKNAVDDVIRSLVHLPEHVHFAILGEGPDEVMLKKLATDLGVAARVKFLGQATHADLPLYLKACDIFIRPSRSEGMGNSFVEAMAAGIPVIATQEGGLSDLIFDEKRDPKEITTAWAVDKDSPIEIADAVKDILGRPEKVSEVTDAAKKMAFEKFDWDLIAKDMKERAFAPLFT